MNNLCHRCSGELTSRDGAASFCPHCGATQLYLLDHLLEDVPADSQTTGAPPPPGVPGAGRLIEWQTVIQSAAFVGAVAALLCVVSMKVAVFGMLGFLWVVSGSVIAIGLYQSRRPAAYMDAATGARIGVVVGLIVAAALGVAIAIAGVVSRYALHGMGEFDATLRTLLQTLIHQTQAQSQGQPMPDEIVRYMFSPEFRAAWMLTVMTTLGVGVLVMSTLGGAFAGFLRTRPRVIEG
ncbi:hypothetical protein SAMN05421770_101280 [Granulicella rosea]|uniref:Uncharacterized protein n=1 Tax=Granulicella rosea TaxID=474952 RepID=A0A239D3N6_9BACT|nr:hypothetical protein [Granulicella rosea]SNS27116.1 hypothetical protein SAMN05421770_101280 [Granulicella rosea]